MPRPPTIVNFPTIGDSAMSEQFQALPMDRQRASAAYPLVYMHDSSITLQKWLRFVGRRCRAASGRSGLIAIRDCRGIVHALFSYRIERDLRIRRRLCIGNLIVAHLPGSQIDAAVAASAESVSAQFDCQTITIEQPFGSRSAAAAGCPTAKLLKSRRRPFGSHDHA
jgi:hypothetical protein